ncbi:MAG: hypothetical protein L0J08_01890 [Micrococcaceae bacterium]|uniref:hypothetical protein n=3 Tax=Arthrobacter TaxID=1663 RepID=UPI002654A97C|nr:hypothetical protein [Micrococcaceae bacterium]
MTATIPEFTDSYSDDMIFLQTVRRSLLRHPLEYHYPKILDATLARLHAVMLVGNVENAINQEHERTGDSKLKDYLKPNGQNNKKKVESLRSYLEGRIGGAVDTEILEDYLAIKNFRNGIIHSDRRTGEKAEHVASRGISLDSRELNLDHLHRFAQVDQAMTMYLGMSHLLEVVGAPGEALNPTELPASRIASDEAVSAPYSFDEFIRFHKSNLDKVGSSWVSLLVEMDELSGPDFVREVRAGNVDGDVGERVRGWGRTAEYSWNEIVRLWPDDSAQRLVDDSKYRAELLHRMRSLAADGAFPVQSLPRSAYAVLWRAAFSHDAPGENEYFRLFDGTTSLTGFQLLETYAVGGVAYDLISNLGMGWIWPLLAISGTEEAVGKANAFIEVFELARTWYSAIERNEGIDDHDKETVEMYRRGVAAT